MGSIEFPEVHENRNITVFSTHVRLRRYKRLNYGISATPELLMKFDMHHKGSRDVSVLVLT